MLKIFIAVCVFSLAVSEVSAQSKSFGDPAQMYNRLMLEKNNTFVRVANFKVNGTPLLFGGQQVGKLYTNGQNFAIVYIDYSTYEQAVEYSTSANSGQPALKPNGIVDSFTILKNLDFQIASDLVFVNGNYINAPDNGFYQRVFTGSQFSLFKKYKSELGIVSTNYVQSDLRQFDLSYEYFYLDTAKKQLKKIKPNLSAAKKEFNDKKEISTIMNNYDFSYDPENALVKLFEALNR